MAQPDPNVIQGASGPDAAQANLLPGMFIHADAITPQEVDAYDQALATAPDEAAMQRFLEVNPQLLIQHLGGGQGRWVIPKKRLGSEYETDFLIAEQDSTGLVWYAVELERPQAKLFNRNGDPSAPLTHALRQIADWRDWLSRNRDYAMRPREQSGLGLRDIEPELEGLVIMGREAETSPRTNQLRRRLSREHRIKIETFDWLSHNAKARLAAQERSRGPSLNGQQPFLLGMLDSILGSSKLGSRDEHTVESAVSQVFGGIATSWLNVSAVREIEWYGVVFELDSSPGDDICVPLKIVHADRRVRPLTPHDWKDWFNYVDRDLDARHSLLVSEQRPDEELRSMLTDSCDGLWYAPRWSNLGWRDQPWFEGVGVFVYMPASCEQSERISKLSAARELLLHYIPEPDHVPDRKHVK